MLGRLCIEPRENSKNITCPQRRIWIDFENEFRYVMTGTRRFVDFKSENKEFPLCFLIFESYTHNCCTYSYPKVGVSFPFQSTFISCLRPCRILTRTTLQTKQMSNRYQVILTGIPVSRVGNRIKNVNDSYANLKLRLV